MCLHSSKVTCYGSNMTQDITPRRRAAEADVVSTTAGDHEAHDLAHSFKDAPVRDLLVAGGRRGFGEAELIRGAA